MTSEFDPKHLVLHGHDLAYRDAGTGPTLLLIHGMADTTVPIADGRRLAAAAGPATVHWEFPDAEHSRGHATAPEVYEMRVTAFLREAFTGLRTAVPIIGRSGPATDPVDPATPVED